MKKLIVRDKMGIDTSLPHELMKGDFKEKYLHLRRLI